MLKDNLKYYRSLMGLTQIELAEKIGLTKMAISNYESGKREADSSTIIKIAKALNIKSSNLIIGINPKIKITHEAFRKKNGITSSHIELIYGKVDRYLQKFYNIMEVLGNNVIPKYKAQKKLRFEDNEQAAKAVRRFLELTENGLVGNITDILENKGFIICNLENVHSQFSGMNGLVNKQPYIAINSNLTYERQRFTLIHELVHMLFNFESSNNVEKNVDAITGMFFIPTSNLLQELGQHRTNILNDLNRLSKKYGVSTQCVLYRAKETGIISNTLYIKHLKKIKILKKSDDKLDLIKPEKSQLFRQLVIRALSERLINSSKALELLDDSVYKIKSLYTEL